jgi:hypothetical protein
VQLATSIWHGVRTPSSANVHRAKQYKRDVNLLHFFGYNSFLRHQHVLEEKSQFVAFIFLGIKKFQVSFMNFKEKPITQK